MFIKTQYQFADYCLLGREMRKVKDLASKQFGLLVALCRKSEGGRSKWLCQCRCGVQKLVRQEDLLKGKSKSCGCARLQFKRVKAERKYSLVNKMFGSLLVLWKSKTTVAKRGRSMMWDCRCDCGRIISVAGTGLRVEKIENCGNHFEEENR